MTQPSAPIHQAPPPLPAPVAQDTARYVAWLASRGTPLPANHRAREDVGLRLGEWSFFDHGGRPGEFINRAAIDRAGHVVFAGEAGQWHALLTAPGVDADVALSRVAWLFRALVMAPTPKAPKVAPPRLAIDGEAATFEGWIAQPPNVGLPIRITIRATPSATQLTQVSANHL